MMGFATKAQLHFVENKGQWHSNVLFKSEMSAGAFFLEEDGYTVLLHDTADIRKRFEYLHNGGFEKSGSFTFHSYAYKVKMEGAQKPTQIVTEKGNGYYENYFIGNDKSKWGSNCKAFGGVTFKNVYPNIDLRYYSDLGTLKYEFIVQPGGNPNAIALRYEGAKRLNVSNNELLVETPLTSATELKPYTYQPSDNKRSEIATRYFLTENVLRFDVARFDNTKPLVIDPTIIFCSFTGSTSDNWGYTATPSIDGSLYGGGIVFETGYPVSPGAYDQTYNGGVAEPYERAGYDIGIFKFNYNGTQKLYATYLGGATGNEQPHSLIEDLEGNLVVAGRTASTDYPITTPVKGAGGGYDIILTKFNKTGTALLGSVKIGGVGHDGVNIEPKSQGAKSLRQNYGDDARSEVIVDAQNNVLLASSTQSADFMDSLGNGIQTVPGGKQDGVILKMSPDLSTVMFATLFGGTYDDACFVISINPLNGNIYVAGGTASPDLPGNKAGSYAPNFQPSVSDGFVTILNPSGTAILKTTYLHGVPILGNEPIDIVYGIKFDKKGFPYVMGTTTGDWPVKNAVYVNVGSKQFIAKMKPDLSDFVYSTVFGKNDALPSISPIAFMVDRCENVYVSGWGGMVNQQTGFTNSTTAGLPIVNPISNIPPPDGSDFYFFVLQKNAASCLLASSFGQNGGMGDHVDGGTSRFDENGVIYQGICANCGKGATFPTTAGVVAPQNNSMNCNEAVVKIAMKLAGVGAKLHTYDSLRGCAPFTVNFQDLYHLGVKYFWEFADGTPEQTTTTPFSTHTFNGAGTFNVRLISEDSATCNIRDTSYLTIKVSNTRATLDFDFVKNMPCENLTYVFDNKSTAQTIGYNSDSFIWDFGDGTPPLVAGLENVSHTYAQTGTYDVKLILKDLRFCNAPDTLVKTIRPNPYIKASFTSNIQGCVPFSPKIKNTSMGGVDFIWQLEDGTVLSTEDQPNIAFTTPGDYKIRLIAIDMSSCNQRDTTTFKAIKVYPGVKADFMWSPIPPIENLPVSFFNTSQNAVRYLWNLGDGTTSDQTNLTHQYLHTDTYSAMLVAFNILGCSDTARREVSTIVNQLLDVPNAFTPGQQGLNNVIKVKAYGVTKLNFRIYNRWGEMVFQSSDVNQGWDGNYKGKPQPMEVYAYTVDAEFFDGKKLTKSGDITLVR